MKLVRSKALGQRRRGKNHFEAESNKNPGHFDDVSIALYTDVCLISFSERAKSAVCSVLLAPRNTLLSSVLLPESD